MAKRYHQSKKYNEGYYEGYDDKKRREMADGSMLFEDRSSIANLPQDVKYHLFPKAVGGLGENLNDGMTGIDNQQRKDNSKMKAHLQPEKY